jgi:hypothetical protein
MSVFSDEYICVAVFGDEYLHTNLLCYDEMWIWTTCQTPPTRLNHIYSAGTSAEIDAPNTLGMTTRLCSRCNFFWAVLLFSHHSLSTHFPNPT